MKNRGLRWLLFALLATGIALTIFHRDRNYLTLRYVF